MKKLNQYELYTSKSVPFDQPFQVFAKTKADAIKYITPRLHKGERITSLKRSWWGTKKYMARRR